MSDRSDHSDDDDNQSRKRHWLAEAETDEITPTKRTKTKKGFGGFLLTPFNSFIGMFYGNDGGTEKHTSKKKQSSQQQQQERVFEVADEDEDDEVVVENTSHRHTEHAGPIIFLNADKPTTRNAAGTDEVVIERHVQRNVEVSDDSENDDVQEVAQVIHHTPSQTSKMEKSFEIQQDDEPAILFEKVVKTPNTQLQEARRFQNELIYLNENATDDSDDVSIVSDTRDKDFISPTPDDSVSRPITPSNHSISSLSNYTTNNVRDFWRRNTAKKTTTIKRAPVRHQFKYSSVSSKSVASGYQKIQKHRQLLSSRDRLLQGIIATGQYDARAISGISDAKSSPRHHHHHQRSTMKNKSVTPTSDVLARARNKIAEINGSRSTTPSLSRESSVIFDGTSAGRVRTPSISSSDFSTRTQKFNDILSQIDSLGIHSTYRGTHRYQTAYEITKRKEDKLLEEARIREGHRAQTRGDRLEDVRKRLELQGITIRPKPDKVINDFMELPDSADVLIEKAWNRGLDPEQSFVESFSIPICRKDLATLSGLNWLNDNIINFYLQLICQRSIENSKYPKTYAFNTFFYTNIVSKGYASVKRWTRKIDIFEYEILLVPVHLGMHWCMAVIDVKDKKIEFYDSLYDGNTAVLPALKNYLASESMDKKKTAFDFSGWTIRQMDEIPRQKNGSDCGVFSCQFGEWASRRTVPRFTQKNMPYYRKRMVHEIVTKKLLATI